MAKGKPRHNPDKPQNIYGRWCPYYEEYSNGTASCECGHGNMEVCKGNKHNCIKIKYKNLACRSDEKKLKIINNQINKIVYRKMGGI